MVALEPVIYANIHIFQLDSLIKDGRGTQQFGVDNLSGIRWLASKEGLCLAKAVASSLGGTTWCGDRLHGGGAHY